MKKSWINIVKGIGITLVVLGHSNIPFILVRYIQSFHMPLFFFISGYLYHQRSCMEFLARKGNTLVIPYIRYSAIYLLIYILLGHNLVDNTKFVISTVLGTQDLLWFLIVLFFTENIFNAIKNMTKEKVLFISIILLGILGHLLSYYKINLYFRIETAMVAIVMFYCGYITNTYLKPIIKNKGFLSYKFFIVPLFLSIVCCFLNSSKVDMRVGDYGNIMLYYFSALSGIYCVFLISLMMKKSRIFEFLGESSMTIYAFNVFIPVTITECLGVIFKHIDLNIIGKLILKVFNFILIYFIILLERYLKK